jgi:hypothetical protein
MSIRTRNSQIVDAVVEYILKITGGSARTVYYKDVLNACVVGEDGIEYRTDSEAAKHITPCLPQIKERLEAMGILWAPINKKVKRRCVHGSSPHRDTKCNDAWWREGSPRKGLPAVGAVVLPKESAPEHPALIESLKAYGTPGFTIREKAAKSVRSAVSLGLLSRDTAKSLVAEGAGQSAADQLALESR